MPTTIQPSAEFKDNLLKMPSVIGLQRIELVGTDGSIVASIENQPGKQGSLAVYAHLQQTHGELNREAAEYGLALFAEHTADARERPGAHPNVDRLLAIAAGEGPLQIRVIADPA